MKLLTKAIETAAIKQFPLGNVWEKQDIVAKFFNPCGSQTYYLMNMDPEDHDYCWGFVSRHEIECGSFSMSDLKSVRLPFGLGIERDLHFEPMNAKVLWEKLQKGEHI